MSDQDNTQPPGQEEERVEDEQSTQSEDEVEDTPQRPDPIHHKRQNVDVDQSPLKGDEHDKGVHETLSCLSITPDELANFIKAYNNVSLANGKDAREWFAALDWGANTLTQGGVFSDSLSRDESHWRQKVEIEGENLGAGRPRLRSQDGGMALTGEQAILRASGAAGLGATVQIPLWHTGIWVSLKAPADGALLELDRRIANEKISLGRQTGGMIFSNSSVYITSYVVNFALAHLYDATVKDTNLETLRGLIKSTDIPTLVWGLLCAMYPNGYPFSQPCTVDPTKCQHVMRTTLNIAKLSFTDNKSLSQWQRRHMQKRNTKHDLETLKRYQEEHVRGGKVVKEVNDHIKISLEVPSVAQMEASGFAWVDGIVRMVEDSFGVSLKGEERDEYILQQGNATALRKFGHWISQIELDEDYVEDRESLDNVLGTLSAQEEVHDTIIEHIGQYIDDSTLSVIGIPKFNCPACGGLVGGDDDTHPHVLPLDVMSIFFILLGQRTNKARSRSRM